MADKHTIPCELLWTRASDGTQQYGWRYEADGTVSFNRYDASGNLAQRITQITSTGLFRVNGTTPNFSTTPQTNIDGALDTYVVGSNVLVPFGVGLVAGTRYRCTLYVSKTNASTAQVTFTIRIGTAGAIGDTSRLAMTTVVAQTAAVGDGIVVVEFVVRTQSATGVIVGGVGVQMNAVGMSSGATAVSSSFDNTAATLGNSTFVGVSINPGASADWTVNQVYAEILLPG